MMAANSASSSSYEVRIRPLMDESMARTSRHTSMPLPSGSRASSTATSGRNAGMRRAASCADPDSPTTSMSPAACSRSARPRRTTSWSSSRNTRIMPHSYRARDPVPRDLSPVPGTDRTGRSRYPERMADPTGNPRPDPPSLGLSPLSRVRLDELLQEMLDRVGEVVTSRERLRALLDAVVGVGSDLDLRSTLQRIVEAACALVGARYGALGVIGPDRLLSDFITHGIDPQTHAKIGDLPH